MFTWKLGETELPKCSTIVNYNSISEDKNALEESYSLDDAITSIGFGYFQVKMLLCVGLIYTSNASFLMALPILLPEVRCAWNLSGADAALIMMVMFLGCVVAAPLWGIMADVHGRKKAVYLSLLLSVTSIAATSQAPNYASFLTFLFFAGVGVGSDNLAPVFITETLPINNRGIMMIVCMVFWSLGTIVAAAIATAVMPAFGWRWYLLALCIPPTVALCSVVCIPETVYCLLTVGKTNQAAKVLKAMARSNSSELPNGKLHVTALSAKKGKLTDLFKPELRWTTILVGIIFSISTIAYFSISLMTTSMFQGGIDGCHPHGWPVNSTSNGTNTSSGGAAKACKRLTRSDYISYLITAAAELPALLVPLLMIDFIGRKRSLSITFAVGGLICSILFLCIGHIYIVVVMFLARCFVAAHYDTLIIYIAEVFPTNVRGVGMMLLCSVSKLFGIASPFLIEMLLDWSFYSIVTLLVVMHGTCAVMALFLPIETKGKSLQ